MCHGRLVFSGDTNREVTVTETFHVQTDDQLSDKELKQIEADDQTIQTILLGLPEDIYASIDSCETAQEIWLRVQQMMIGSDIGIQEKKAKLFNKWERFTSNEGESIESYYHHFLKLMNDLKRNKHFPEKIASNLKFLNNLQPEWSQHVTIVHQTKDLHTADYTQLYDLLKYNQKENAGNLTGYNDVWNIGNQIGNGNLVVARAEGNTAGQNGNQIRCYNCRGVADLDEIEEVNANCILLANLQQASTSGTQTDSAPVYDSDGSAEYTELLEPILESHHVPHNDNNVISKDTSVEQGGETVEQHHAKFEKTRALYELLYQNLAIEVKKVNLVNHKLKETNADLTTELARFKNQTMCFEISQEKYDKLKRGYQQSVYQEQCLSKKINALHLSTEKTLQLAQESREKMKQLNKEIKPANYTKINHLSGEATKFVGNFKSLVNEVDESLAKHTALELEIERLLKAVVSQDIMTIVQKESVVVTSDLQTELERTKERFENCIIKKENKYTKLWNDWYKKCDECKYDKISYDKAYKHMQQKIERLQAQLGDLNGKSKDTSYVSDTHNPLSQKLESDTNQDVPVNETFHVQTDDELTEKELKQIEADDQAIQTILLGLPEDIYAAVNSCETAQEIWLRVQQMMKGSDIRIQEKKAKLFNEWERFTFNEGASIESYYHHFLKLMNDLKRNKHFPEKIVSNLKFQNNLQPEWSRHVTIVHQTKDLHTADYTQLYDFLKYNQKEVDELKAERLVKTQDPLALMANSNNPYVFSAPHQDQPSFNQNYMQQPMPNPKDITDPTTAMNMALALMAKAFKLNYSTPTNNNQRISSNPRNRQIAQPRNLNGYNDFQNIGNQVIQNAVQDPRVQNIGNQNGNGNLVATRAKGNTAGQNGNQIRCYNCRGVCHYDRNCTVRPRRRHAAYLQTQLLIAQKEEAGIQLQAEEYDLMAAVADLDEIEEVNANCILMANLQQTSTSGTQTDKAPVYDTDGSAEDMSENTKFAKQPLVENLPKVGETNALSKPVTSNSVSTPQESKGVNNDKVIALGMFRINPFKTSREEKHVPNTTTLRPEDHRLGAIQSMIGSPLRLRVVKARIKKLNKNSRGKKQKAKVSFKENQMKYQPKVTKPKKVGTRESLATSKPRKSRLLLRWSPTGRLFDSSDFESQSDCSNGDNACTSNILEPKIKRFPNSTSLLDRSKDEAPAVIITFLKRITVLLQSPVIIIRTDNGTEFKNQAIATACFTQNRFIIHRRFNKTQYEHINDRKPDISFLYVFGALFYPKNDREDIGKLGAKGDIGLFIGYSADSRAYRIYN
nr:retrovirus-related Pol polyprotein from transposon TNT 1-94 [Tanacetum cinerariifolium]